MRLNKLKPADGSKKTRKRVARGVGSGWGKTAGRGHKGQKSRSGGFNKIGFEGGQMPIARRVPKFGFTSRTAGDTAEVRLYHLEALEGDRFDLAALKEAGVVHRLAKRAKVVKRGELTRAVTLDGIHATAGAKAAIEAAGGKLENIEAADGA